MDAANAYEALMVPALFRPWAEKVADAVQIGRGQRVLDVACGTGVLAREVASRTGSPEAVAGVDCSPGMIAVARTLAPAIDWRQGVAEAIPFPTESFDVVVSQFGLMFFEDRGKALRDMLRVLVPGGRLAVAVWDSLEETPAYADEVELVERLAGRRAADPLRAPFALGNRHDLATLFRDAGVASVEVRTGHTRARFPTIRVMVEADIKGWLPLVGVVLPEEQIVRILQEAEAVLSQYVSADASVAFDTTAHVVTGAKP